MKTHYVKAVSYNRYLTRDPNEFGTIDKAQAFSEQTAKQLANLYSIFVSFELGRIEAVKIEKDCKIHE